MKGIDIFCVSQSSTAISHSMEEISPSSLISPSSSSTNILLPDGAAVGGGRAIDRHNPIITDSRRLPKSLTPSTNPSQTPPSPNPAHKDQPKKKKHHKISLKENGDPAQKKDGKSIDEVDKDDKPEDEKITEKKIESLTSINDGKIKITGTIVRKGWSCTRPGDFISPPGSTRYLLGEKISFNSVSDFDPAQLKIFPEETSNKSNYVKKDEETEANQPSSLSDAPDQVVVLRVSLHCRGCERKMRKHISRMEGVKSFDIDFVAKKVTVTGKVTPLSVLSSISKVKNAQLLSPAISSAVPTPANLNNSPFIQNEYKGAGA